MTDRIGSVGVVVSCTKNATSSKKMRYGSSYFVLLSGRLFVPVRTTPDRLYRFDLHPTQEGTITAILQSIPFDVPSHFWGVGTVSPCNKGKVLSCWFAFCVPHRRTCFNVPFDEVLPPLSVCCSNRCWVVDVAHQIHFCEALRRRCWYSTPCRQ